MTTLEAIGALLSPHHLVVRGGFLVAREHGLPETTKSIVLISPSEPGFWPHFQSEPEWQNGATDPLDRWSRRVISSVADRLEATAFYPFDGPPWHPFHQWALRSGQAWASPVHLLVHADMGLFASRRGALALREALSFPPQSTAPCGSCMGKPCLTACPAGALTKESYNVPKCHSFLAVADGQDCMNLGCAVRRACPVSLAYARLAEHSAYHMGQFHT